jgi:hypothetical protein
VSNGKSVEEWLIAADKDKGKIHPRTGYVVMSIFSFLNFGASCGWTLNVNPRRSTPGNDAILIVWEDGGPQDRSGRLQKISFPPGFDSRTVQPVASRYTIYARIAADLKASCRALFQAQFWHSPWRNWGKTRKTVRVQPACWQIPEGRLHPCRAEEC